MYQVMLFSIYRYAYLLNLNETIKNSKEWLFIDDYM